MNSATREAFVTYFDSPKRLFLVMVAVLVACLAVAVIKVMFRAWHDHQSGRRGQDHDETDLIWTLARVLILFLVFMVLFTH